MQVPQSIEPVHVAGADKVAASPQLTKAANDFEASFLGELLKPMREDPLFGEGSGLGGDSLGSDGPGGAMGTIGNLASEALAQSIAKQGGLGIAKEALEELAPVEAAHAAAAGKLSGPGCGACAVTLEKLGAESGLDAGHLAMLGQGSIARAVDGEGKEEGKPDMEQAIPGGRNWLRRGAVRAIARPK